MWIRPKDALAKGKEIAIASNNQKAHFVSLYWLGDLYAKHGLPQKAIQSYLQSLKIAKEVKHSIGMYNSLIGLGMGYRNLGDYPNAVKYFLQADYK